MARAFSHCQLGFRRCKTDPNLYVHKDCDLYVLAYVDDLSVIGDPLKVKPMLDLLSKEFLQEFEGGCTPFGRQAVLADPKP